MDLIGKVVVHKIFGEGMIQEINGRYITVKFAHENKQFVYPGSIGKYLYFQDGSTSKKGNELFQSKRRVHTQQEKPQNKKVVTPPQPQRKIPYYAKREFSESNIAFKCNFCNGGKTKESIGFNGACSDDLIRYNINIAKHTWCKDIESPCFRYCCG